MTQLRNLQYDPAVKRNKSNVRVFKYEGLLQCHEQGQRGVFYSYSKICDHL